MPQFCGILIRIAKPRHAKLSTLSRGRLCELCLMLFDCDSLLDKRSFQFQEKMTRCDRFTTVHDPRHTKFSLSSKNAKVIDHTAPIKTGAHHQLTNNARITTRNCIFKPATSSHTAPQGNAGIKIDSTARPELVEPLSTASTLKLVAKIMRSSFASYISCDN